MVTVLLILLVIYVVYRVMRRDYHDGGKLLNCLLTHYLIDQNQYMWRNLGDDQLRDTLIAHGVLNASHHANSE
jgi:hypothetical protein